MHKFYDDLKGYILKQDEDTKATLIPYYETLYQLENYPELKEFLTIYEEGNYTLDYNEPEDHDFSSNGWFEVYEMKNKISYNIELDIGTMKGHYCTCKPEDEGYNSDKGCCGVLCDAHLPEVSIVKEVKMIKHEFQGYECDLWVLEEKWFTEHEKDLLQKKKLEKVSKIEAQIVQLQEELKVVKSELKN
ncbi:MULTISPECIES: hypothetical protein [unclassified Lysinibacillus]|uniref:hypothetical protein n=1 Tax=unclassified Lysinibacillus TaxID=2636778 RepID=UPI00201183CD|nr:MULTISPECIES: hypothetical protein [unclassified Lysinibacillus]MCL1696390.1 hypothetical protein [Lysinibacillus sp. BPa_S21]MCL1700723.1 hypothetical protein [Lysinibacillus sp. Bpr_S20]